MMKVGMFIEGARPHVIDLEMDVMAEQLAGYWEAQEFMSATAIANLFSPGLIHDMNILQRRYDRLSEMSWRWLDRIAPMNGGGKSCQN